MDILEIELTNKNALKLLLDLEEMDLIKVLKKKPTLSSLRSQIKLPMSNEQINEQLESLSNEWKRDIGLTLAP